MKSIPSKARKQKRNPSSTTNKRGRRVGLLSEHIDLPAFLRWLQVDGLLSLRDCESLTGISDSVVAQLIAADTDRPVPIQVCAAVDCFVPITQRNKDEYCCKACRYGTKKPGRKGAARPKALPNPVPSTETDGPRICADHFCQNELRSSNKSGFCVLHAPRWKKR